MKLLNKTWLVYPAIFLLSIVIFLAHYVIAGQAVYGDGIDYWAYLHTIYFDHDLNFSDEFRHMYGPQWNNTLPETMSPVPLKTEITRAGNVDDVHPFGMALLLFPFFILADGIVLIVNFFGLHLVRNGYSDTYQITCGIAAIGYATFGLYVLEKTIKLLGFDSLIARGATLVFFFSTDLIYYFAYDVLNSHFASFFLVSVFWYLFVGNYPKKTYKRYFLYGLLIGLATVTRLEDALLLIPVGADLLYAFIKNSPRQPLRHFFLLIIGLLAGFWLIVTPLMIQWHYLYGSIFNYTEFIHLKPHGTPIWGSLLSLNNGLLTITPIIALALMMLPIAFKEKKLKSILILLSIFFAAQIIVLARHGGWVGSSYGGRMYISTSLLFVILLAWLIQRFRSSLVTSKIIVLIFIGFIVLNIFKMGNFILFTKEASGGRRGIETKTLERIHKLLPEIKPV